MTPMHGDIRGHRYETEVSDGQVLRHAVTGERIGTMSTCALTVTVSERYCRRCGWSEVRGVMGALRWHAEHDGHGGEG